MEILILALLYLASLLYFLIPLFLQIIVALATVARRRYCVGNTEVETREDDNNRVNEGMA